MVKVLLANQVDLRPMCTFCNDTGIVDEVDGACPARRRAVPCPNPYCSDGARLSWVVHSRMSPWSRVTDPRTLCPPGGYRPEEAERWTRPTFGRMAS